MWIGNYLFQKMDGRNSEQQGDIYAYLTRVSLETDKEQTITRDDIVSFTRLSPETEKVQTITVSVIVPMMAENLEIKVTIVKDEVNPEKKQELIIEKKEQVKLEK